MSIPVFRPCFDEEEVDAVREVLMSGWVGPGQKVEELEKRFAEYVGTEFALSMNSCSSALFTALKVIGVEGREVVTTAQTFVSTNHAILQNGATPVGRAENWSSRVLSCRGKRSQRSSRIKNRVCGYPFESRRDVVNLGH